MWKKKLLSIVSGVLVFALLATSCTSSNNDPGKDEAPSDDPSISKPGEYPISKEKITMTIGVKADPLVKDYKNNGLTKYLEEKGNMDLQFEIFPEAEAAQKLQLMVTSDSQLPEVLMGIGFFPDAQIYQYGQQKTFLALNDYIDKYGYWFKKVLQKDASDNLGIKGAITYADGNIYAIPRYVQNAGNEWSGRAWINKAWLDKLGLKMPETTDEFYQVLKAFKTKDPNGNGKADEIPLIGSNNGWREKVYDFFINAFIYNEVYDYRLNVENGKLKSAMIQDEWRDAIKYLSGLSKEGLLSPLSFTQNANQLLQLLQNPDAALVGVYTAGGARFAATNQRKLDYVALPPLKGPKGVQFATKFTTIPIGAFAITKYCKNPVAAFRLGDLMLSDDFAIRSRWGVPDVDWKEAGPNDKGLYESLGVKGRIKPILNWGTAQSSHWQENNPVFRTFEVSDSQIITQDPMENEYKHAQAVPLYINKAPKELVGKLSHTADEQAIIDEIRQPIIDYFNSATNKFITGEMNIDTEWDKYKAELEKLQLKKFVETEQTAYTRKINGSKK